jgi:hypothetical protein
MTDLEAAAGALGGDVHNGGVLAPGPGHSPKDRSMWVVFGPEYPDGFWCKTWAGDDWKACRDHVKWALGIRDGERPKFERTPRPAVNPREIEAKSDFAVKQYYRAQPPQRDAGRDLSAPSPYCAHRRRDQGRRHPVRSALRFPAQGRQADFLAGHGGVVSQYPQRRAKGDSQDGVEGRWQRSDT